jgi:hypothetical protein|nr:MAG TPA: Baseplate wedge protein [Caudoviricetes sp.]
MADVAQFPHVTNSTAAVNRWEPMVPSNFNCHFVLLDTLKDKLGDYSFLSEYVKSVNGLFIEYAGNTIEGGYKIVKFRYDSNEKQTYYDVEVAFHNFLDSESKALVYNALVAWSRQKYNPLTGEKSLKKHYANACIVVEKFNRDGTLYWRRVGHNCFPMNDFPDMIADYATHDMAELTVTFNVDWVTDVTNDPRLSIES